MPTVKLLESDAAMVAVARVSQKVEIRLVGDRPATAWEIGPTTSDALERVADRPFPEFVPAPNQSDPWIGTYVFHFYCARAGESVLQFDYLYPAGPGERRRTEFVRSVKFQIRVENERPEDSGSHREMARPHRNP